MSGCVAIERRFQTTISAVDKVDYLSAMARSVVNDVELKHLLKAAGPP